MRPRGPLTTWLRAPSDSSTARTVAWSPPTRAWDTERVPMAVVEAPTAPAPDTRTGWRYRLRPFLRPFLLIGPSSLGVLLVGLGLGPPPSAPRYARGDFPAKRGSQWQAGGWGSRFGCVGWD